MPFTCATVDWIFIVRWSRFDPNDTARVLERVADARRIAKQPLIYLSIIEADAPVPTSRDRKALDALAGRLDEYCDAYHLVLEGDGMKHALQRAIVSGAGLFARRTVSVYRTVDEAVARIAVGLKEQPPSLRARLGVSGLV